MKDKLKKFFNTFGYVVLFFASFLFFVYFTFPYGVLKEAVTAQISKATGLAIRVKELGPSFPLGFEASDVSVRPQAGGAALELESVEASVGLLNMLIGRIAVDVELESKNHGTLDLATRLPITQAIFEQNFIPSRVLLEAENFAIGHAIGFLLANQAADPNVNPLISGMLTKIGMKGNLQGNVDLDLDVGDPARSSGSINLQVKDALLTVDDPSLNLTDQKFKKALVKAEMKQGSLSIAKDSGFHTQELIANFSGNINLKQPIPSSTLDLAIDIQLMDNLKEQFGLILDMAGGSGAAVKYQVRGTIGRPNLITL